MNEITQSLRIDEEGYLQSGEIRLVDAEYGRHVLQSIKRRSNGSYFHIDSQGQEIEIEAFDEPYVLKTVDFLDGELWGQTPYEYKVKLNKLCVDEFDRFHAVTEQNIPVVFSRTAQATLFDLCTSYDDDSISLGDQKITIPDFFSRDEHVVMPTYWDNRYEQNQTSWDLGGAHPALISSLPQLKLVRSRILVIGCGKGHDAAFLAQQGHIVTAIDFSEKAISEAKAKYSHIPHLSFEVADFFKFANEHTQSFDMVLEHTLFPALSPADRSRYSKSVKRVLCENGFLLGIFFATSSRTGPPFGSTEWEIQKRLAKDFQSLYWQRIKNSPESRKGKEFLVFARKKSQTV